MDDLLEGEMGWESGWLGASIDMGDLLEGEMGGGGWGGGEWMAGCINRYG